jgi:type IV pilus assembly protein PilY1
MTASSPVWSAQSQLDTKTGDACDNRRIYLMRPGSTASLVNFTWDSQACDSNFLPTGTADTGLNAAEKAHFSAANVQLLSQYPGMTDGSAGSPNQRSAAQGANLVNFLRGQRGAENFEAGAAGKLYRKRDHVLGDIIGGQPVHVKGPVFTYQDPGYDAFKASHATRTPMLYVPANDGMLHAFYAGVQPPRDTDLPDPNGGKEAWAIIPSAVLPKLYLLADTDYRNLHQFYVDGTPVVGDIADAGSNWKTVLVGGLNAGGKGYYALDVTDPANPRALWEFNFSSTCYDGTSATAGADCNLGLSFGKPIITKVLDASYPQGRWVVLLTSGYNNVNGTAGDGQGYLYVLDANTGKILYKIATGAGDAATPSGLAQINTYVDDGAINNTALRVYGGDLLGNVWRFDVNDTHSPSGREATLLGQAKDRSETPQPITTRLELAEVKGKPMVFAATGRLLGASDLADTQVQSIYGIVDPLNGSPVYSDLRAALRPLAMAPAGTSDPARRSISCDGSTSECAATSGWVVDLPDAGERVNVDMQMVLGTLVIGSNVPQSSACSTGGYSWFNYLDFATGTAVTAEPADGVYVSEYLADSLIVGFNSMRLPSGEFRALLRTSSPSSLSRKIPATTPPPIGKRISWREIAQ